MNPKPRARAAAAAFGLSLLLSLLTALPAAAHGDVQCPEEPKAQWQPQMALQRKLVDEGWRVRQVKVLGNCYEVYGFNAQGERVEAFFNPRTFERVLPAAATPATPGAAASKK